jgi:hypothetical protein
MSWTSISKNNHTRERKKIKRRKRRPKELLPIKKKRFLKVIANISILTHHADYYSTWTSCLIPSVRETCCVLLSCT